MQIERKPSYPAKAGYPVRRGLSIPPHLLWNTGSSAFADDDSRGVVQIRISNKLHKHTSAISPRIRASFVSNIPPSESEGAGNAGRPERPQPRVVCSKHAR
jgi:hypothetical protein